MSAVDTYREKVNTGHCTAHNRDVTLQDVLAELQGVDSQKSYLRRFLVDEVIGCGNSVQAIKWETLKNRLRPIVREVCKMQGIILADLEPPFAEVRKLYENHIEKSSAIKNADAAKVTLVRILTKFFKDLRDCIAGSRKPPQPLPASRGGPPSTSPIYPTIPIYPVVPPHVPTSATRADPGSVPSIPTTPRRPAVQASKTLKIPIVPKPLVFERRHSQLPPSRYAAGDERENHRPLKYFNLPTLVNVHSPQNIYSPYVTRSSKTPKRAKRRSAGKAKRGPTKREGKAKMSAGKVKSKKSAPR